MLVVFGAINVDLVFPVPHLAGAGDTVWSEAGRIELGGKGASQAVAAARAGARVSLVGAVGADVLGDWALGELARAGVSPRDIARGSGATGRAAICVTGDAHTTVVVDRGANREARAGQVGAHRLDRATTLLLQMDAPPEETAALIARARAAGCRVILNFSPAGVIDAEALRAVDLLVGNGHELAWLGELLGTGNNPASIHAALGVATVRMMGPQGAEAMSEHGFAMMPAPPVDMRDTTGAADCFVGVLAAGLARGETLALAMRRAAVAAALSTTRVGALSSMPGGGEIDAALGRAPWPTDQQPEPTD